MLKGDLLTVNFVKANQIYILQIMIHICIIDTLSCAE